MANSPIIAQDSATTTTTASGGGYKVDRDGHGILVGDQYGATPTQIQVEGALKYLSDPSGRFMNIIMGTEDGVFCVAKATIAADATGPTEIKIIGGLKGCIFTRIIIKRPSATLTAGMGGRLHTSATPGEANAVIPAIDIGGMTAYDVRLADAYQKLSEPAVLRWVPTGPAGSAGSTFELEAYAHTEWFANIPKPLPARTT